MTRGLVKAAAYRPRFTDGVRRLAGPDEDALTFLAAVVERAVPPGPATDRPQTVHWLGPSPAPDPSAVTTLFGAPVRLGAVEARPGSVAEALEIAARGEGPHWVVSVACAGSGPAATLGPPGDGAVAFLIEDAPGSRPVPSVPGGGAGDGVDTFARLMALGPPRADGEVWVGSWAVEPSQGLPLPTTPPGNGSTPPYTVSQGAYVAARREEESRPSRWRFLADRCGSCGTRTFPSRGRCRVCGSTDALRPEALPLGGATVVAVTWIAPGGQPTEFDLQVEATGPYGVVLAEIAPEVRATLMLTDTRAGEIRVGSKVDTVLRRLYPMEGTWRYGRKAVPPA